MTISVYNCFEFILHQSLSILLWKWDKWHVHRGFFHKYQPGQSFWLPLWSQCLG